MSKTVPCPYCGEEILAQAMKCKHCREFLDGRDDYRGGPPPKKSNAVMTVIIVLAVVVSLLIGAGVLAAMVLPNMLPNRGYGNEAAAIGGLKTIGTAQSLFREGDKEGDEVLDYGSLQELGDQMLIDSVLASGTKQGYTFECQASPITSEFLWMAVAGPIEPDTTGSRWFATNHEGVTYYSENGPATLNPECKIPTGFKPVGR